MSKAKRISNHEIDIHERVRRFMASPNFSKRLRRNVARAYHPDRLPEHLKELGSDIMSRINDYCDKLDNKGAS